MLNSNGSYYVTVRVANNGLAPFSSPALTFRYSRPLSATALRPITGSRLGGTTVTVQGTGFLPDAPMVCFFGHQSVPARYISNAAVACQAPLHQDIAAVQQIRVASAAVVNERQRLELKLYVDHQFEGKYVGWNDLAAHG